jgi:hypothetical protein
MENAYKVIPLDGYKMTLAENSPQMVDTECS